MRKEGIHTEMAPAAIGPYSQAIRSGNFLFISGQIPLDPVTGEVVTGDIQAQTHRVLKNVMAIVTAAGGTMESIVKTSVFIKDMEEFGKINEVYATYFAEVPPARACVEVSRLPKDVGVEIEAVAVISD